MGCCSSKQIINAVKDDAQVNKLDSKNLPSEVITGLDKVSSQSNSAVSVVKFHKISTNNIDRVTSEETQRLGSRDISPLVNKTEVSILDQTSKNETDKTKVSDFHLSPAPKRIPLQQEKDLSGSMKPSANVIMSETTNGEEAMLNVLYDQPVTSQYLELLKTQREGKQPLSELWEPASEEQAPTALKVAFLEEMEEPSQELSSA